jgi:polar amino acid transport system substrate-binding protein
MGTMGQVAAEKIDGLKRIDKYYTSREALDAVKQGKADTMVLDELVAMFEMRQNPETIEVVGELFHIERYGIGVRKGRNDTLLQRINDALKKLKDDGTLDRLYRKWILEEE